MEWDIDKKWKYLHFYFDDGPDGWKLDFSDERLPTASRNSLLSAEQINGRLIRDELFHITFNAIATDPQFIECSNGLHIVHLAYTLGKNKDRKTWKVRPFVFNRNLWKAFSHYCRLCRREGWEMLVFDFDWMTTDQLRLAKRLCEEVLCLPDTNTINKILKTRCKNP